MQKKKHGKYNPEKVLDEKVNVLFYYVKSKGREIFFDEESNDFDLIFGFPPKSLENSKYNTLDDEGLFPNAYIQIREKE